MVLYLSNIFLISKHEHDIYNYRSNFIDVYIKLVSNDV